MPLSPQSSTRKPIVEPPRRCCYHLHHTLRTADPLPHRYALLFICAGGLVLQRIGRWDTSIAFLGTYAALETARSLWLGWTWDVTYHRLISGSLLIFAFFMVTDPRSIPDRPTARFIWACCLALLTFILRNQFYLSTAPFWALFFLAPLSPVLDALWPSDRFEWRMEN